MWLNLFFLTLASLCVGFILGWVVARPRRWGAFAGETPHAHAGYPGPYDADTGADYGAGSDAGPGAGRGAGFFARGA
jgi:hypothetical protein